MGETSEFGAGFQSRGNRTRAILSMVVCNRNLSHLRAVNGSFDDPMYKDMMGNSLDWATQR